MHLLNPFRHLRRTTLVMALAAVGVTAMTMTVDTPTASASSTGCTYTSFPNEYVCFTINAKGTNVDSFVVIRGKAPTFSEPLKWVCKYEASVKVVAPNGNTSIWPSRYHGPCVFARAEVTIKSSHSFPSGSRACGSFYENKVRQDTACNRIHK